MRPDVGGGAPPVDASGAPLPMTRDLFSIDPVMLASSRSKALALLPQMPWIGRAAQPFALRGMLLLVWLWLSAGLWCTPFAPAGPQTPRYRASPLSNCAPVSGSQR